jgi:ABC-type sugar transport system ATPase subunit
MVRLTPLLNKFPGACSGGESQRVALARTLVTNPSTFLLDEPLSSLDAKLRRELRAECDRLHQELKKTFIFVTHDQEEAMTLADRIVVMRDGDIEQVGSPMEIYSEPATDFVADFFGSPSMNLVLGEIAADDATPCFRSPHFSLTLPGEAVAASPTGSVTLGIRPEHVRVQRDVGAGADLVLPVRLVEPLGKDTLLYFDIGAERPFIAITEGLALAELDAGERVGLTLSRDRLFVFGADGKRVTRRPAPPLSSSGRATG